MAGGANDFALDATDLETWQTPYLAFIDQVNKVYSSPQIVIFTYPLESAPTASYNQTTYYLQYMTSLYNSARLQGLSNVQLIQLNGINFPIDGWCDGHPSVAAHANIADQLTVYLKAVLPQWANSTYPLVATIVWSCHSELVTPSAHSSAGSILQQTCVLLSKWELPFYRTGLAASLSSSFSVHQS
ncbi:hypothetical protein WJX82_002867 [Trebouxia sp. C0006]